VGSLKSEVVAALIAHARDAAPDECCGVLLGRGDEIVEAVRARNAAKPSTTRFLIDPKDHIDARRDARTRGLDVVGFYHSHPRSGAAPSDTDLAEATYPGGLYVIVGLGADPPEVRVFGFDNGNFHERPLVTVG
jgi:proteasome lid subunit RPN8/RPN11